MKGMLATAPNDRARLTGYTAIRTATVERVAAYTTCVVASVPSPGSYQSHSVNVDLHKNVL